MTTVQDFFDSNAITGVPTPEQAAQLLELPQGDTASAETAAPPVAAPAPAADETNTTKDAEPTADNAVLLAKDGKHVIPFDKLTEARESAQQATAERDAALRRAAELQAQLDAAKPPAAPAEPAQPAEAATDLTALREERYEAIQLGDKTKVLELDSKIEAEIQRQAEERVMRRLDAKTAEAQARTEADAFQRAASELKARYPALDDTSDKADREAIDFVVYKRDSLIAAGIPAPKALEQAVEKAAALFRWSNGQAAPTPRQSAADAAAAAIAAAKQPTPATLSDIPGGRQSGLSLESQLANKSGPEMLDLMQDNRLSREQIEDYLNRTI